MLGLGIVQNSSTIVYCMTETNLCPPRPEIRECSTNKGSAAALPRYSLPHGSALHLRCWTNGLGGKRHRNLHRAHFLTFPPSTPLLPAPTLNAGECKMSGGESKVSRRPASQFARSSLEAQNSLPLFLVAFSRHCSGSPTRRSIVSDCTGTR
jgi:hypothetical protein